MVAQVEPERTPPPSSPVPPPSAAASPTVAETRPQPEQTAAPSASAVPVTPSPSAVASPMVAEAQRQSEQTATPSLPPSPAASTAPAPSAAATPVVAETTQTQPEQTAASSPSPAPETPAPSAAASPMVAEAQPQSEQLAEPSPAVSEAETLAEAQRYLDAKDYAKALPLLQKDAAAGNLIAMNNLGDFYARRQGDAQDYAKAFDWFYRAADLGDSYAMMKLGRLYLRKGTPADDTEGLRWLTRAYEAPKPNLEAGAYVADCYLSGKGTKQDVQKAESIITPLANQNVVPAMTLAGRLCEYKADSKLTEARNTSSARKRNELAAQALDLYRQARMWWEKAAAGDDWNASAHLGRYYEAGIGGLEKNEEEAEKRYKEGVNHGNALSMFFYGLLVDKKPGRHAEAEKFIKQAATAGIPSARKWCKDHDVTFPETVPDDDRP